MLTMKNFLILLLIGCFIACDQTEYNLTPSVVGYPMRAGMKWTYDRQVIIKKFTSTSSSVIRDVDTLNSEVSVWVEKDTVLNKKTLKVFKSKEEGMAYASAWFVLVEKKGLSIYASQNPGLNAFTHQGLTLKLATTRPSFSDTILVESSPALELKLPLLPDSSWIYRYPKSTDSLQIEKVVAGTETLSVIGMKINCYKLEWMYTHHSLYKGFQTTEWYSEKGLMKRIANYDRITFINEKDEPMYDGQYSETLTLKSFRYK